MAINIPYPVIDMVKTGENIKKIREEQNVSVAEVQQFLGLSSPQAIYQWQKGISLPTVDHLCALSHLLDIPMDDIIVLAGRTKRERSAVVRIAKQIPMAAKRMLLLTAA